MSETAEQEMVVKDETAIQEEKRKLEEDRKIIGSQYEGRAYVSINHRSSWHPMQAGHVRALTREQLGATRNQDIRSGMFEIYYVNSSGGWWKTEGDHVQYCMAYTRNEMDVLNLTDALVRCGRSNILYQLSVEEIEARKKLPRRRCSHTKYIHDSLAHMLQQVPTNDTFRALLAKKVGELPPKEVDTWEKIVEWVEYTFPKDKPANAIDKDAVLVKIPFDASREESGRCDYWRRLRGTGTFTITPKIINDLMAACEDRQHLYERLREHMESVADRAMSVVDSQHSDYDPSEENDGISIEYSTATLNRAVDAYIQNYGTAEAQDSFLE